jgi:hypothetical protein
VDKKHVKEQLKRLETPILIQQRDKLTAILGTWKPIKISVEEAKYRIEVIGKLLAKRRDI